MHACVCVCVYTRLQWLSEYHGIHLNVWHATLTLSRSLFHLQFHSSHTLHIWIYIRVPNFIMRIKSINFTNYNVNFYNLKWYSNGYKRHILIDRKNPVRGTRKMWKSLFCPWDYSDDDADSEFGPWHLQTHIHTQTQSRLEFTRFDTEVHVIFQLFPCCGNCQTVEVGVCVSVFSAAAWVFILSYWKTNILLMGYYFHISQQRESNKNGNSDHRQHRKQTRAHTHY